MTALLSAVDAMTILYSALVLLALALVFGVLLAVLGKKLAVKEDERVAKVREHLSGANCGACGYAGCDAFAKAVAEGKADVSGCAATSAEEKRKIGEILGVEVKAEETIIVVACNGGNAAADRYEYMGYGDCRSMEMLAGGRKACAWGCLGMGSCEKECPVGAIKVGKDGYAEIDHGKCIACGKCVAVCPKMLIKRIPADAVVYIACSNCLRGAKAVHALCENGCIGCGLCAKICPSGAVTLTDNQPVIDYDKCTGCGLCASKCPAKCIKITDYGKRALEKRASVE